MQAFYQGKIDNFCAYYAVLNALQVLFRITPQHARKIFNRVLYGQIRNPAVFLDILEHKTDYVAQVDSMLENIQRIDFPQLRVESPLLPGASCQEIWETLRIAASPSLPVVSVFRFLRMVPQRKQPYSDHWTVGHYMDAGGLHLLDCSLEPGGLYCLPFSRISDRPREREYVVIPPESVRILSASGVMHSPV